MPALTKPLQSQLIQIKHGGSTGIIVSLFEWEHDPDVSQWLLEFEGLSADEELEPFWETVLSDRYAVPLFRDSESQWRWTKNGKDVDRYKGSSLPLTYPLIRLAEHNMSSGKAAVLAELVPFIVFNCLMTGIAAFRINKDAYLIGIETMMPL